MKLTSHLRQNKKITRSDNFTEGLCEAIFTRHQENFLGRLNARGKSE